MSPAAPQAQPSRARRWWAERGRRTLHDQRLTLLLLVAALALVLGFVGFLQTENVVDAAYDTLALLALNFEAPPEGVPWTVDVARFLAPAAAAYATFTALTALLREQADVVRAQLRRDHVVVCGLGRRGLQLVKSFRAGARPVVAIESQRESASLEEARRAGAAVIVGDASQPDVLRRAGVGHAAQLVAVCGPDATNAAIAASARQLARSKGHRLDVFAHIGRSELTDDLTGIALRSEDGLVSVEWFNTYDRAARAMLREHLDLERSAAEGRPPHIAVVGLDELATALVLNSSRQWAALATGAGRLGITVAAPGASAFIADLEARYPALAKVADLTGYDRDLRSLADAPDAAERLADAGAVFVCGQDDTATVELAFAVARAVGPGSPIVVRLLVQSSGFAELLDDGGRPGSAGIQVFGLIERTASAEMVTDSLHETLARMFHEQYVEHVRRKGRADGYEQLGDYDDLDPTFKEANRAQARDVSAKLGAVDCDVRPLSDWAGKLVDFSPDEVELLAKLEHERWNRERLEAGWKPGPERDDERRINPYIADWDELPDDVKEFDRIFVRGLPRTLARAGYEVYRTPRGARRAEA